MTIKKDYAYYEKLTPGKGKKVVLKEIYGSRFSKKTGVVIQAMPTFGNYWLIQFGKDKAVIPNYQIDRVIVPRVKK